MILNWKKNSEPIKSAKAYGFKILNNSKVILMWIPKSQVERFDESKCEAVIPDWLYDKKINELFF